MGKRLKKKKRKQNLLNVFKGKCPGCGKRGPHFVPPSFGDKGFFICQPIVEEVNSQKDLNRIVDEIEGALTP